MDATAVIHFIGLVLFTTQMTGPNNTARIGIPQGIDSSQIIGIMPRVGSGDPMQPSAPPRRRASRPIAAAAAAAPAEPPAHVEDHVALMAFLPCDLLAVSGWEVKKLNSAYLYIRLNREQISFVADGNNGPAKIDTHLGHLGGTQLHPEFSPPLYPGAAAVFLIPNGKFRACVSTTAGVTGRLDTKLDLANHGTITIKADGGKSITFNGGATVVIMNVPWLWAESHTITHSAVPHFTVYCAMTGDAQCDFNKIGPPDDLSGIEQCIDGAFKQNPGTGSNAPTASSNGVPPETASVDVFCSTTSWP